MPYRDSYEQGQSDYFWTLPRAMLAILSVVVAIFLLLVVTTPLTIGFGWFSGEANLRSFQHVRQTYQEGFDDVRGLDALTSNICIAKGAVSDARKSGDENVVVQRQSQLYAYEGRFNSLRAEYDAYMQDHFRGGVIRPHQLPLPYPMLAEKIKAVC